MVDFGFNIWPSVKVIADGNDISRFFSPAVSTISITDEIELNADKLEISFPAGQFAIPRKGAEIEVFLGYWPLEKSMGKFIVDTRGGDFIHFVKISASASPHSENTAGRVFMQEQKSRHFDEGTTLGDLISIFAGGHGLEPVCAPSLAKIVLPHLVQKNESDMHFLTRVTSRYGASAKPANGKLVCVKRASGQDANDEDIPPFIITLGKISTGSWEESDSDTAGTVIAKYRDLEASETKEIKAGEGDPVRTLPQVFSNEQAATSAAQAMLDKITQTMVSMSFTLRGDPDMFADRPITPIGLEFGIPTSLASKRVVHNLNGQGYSMTIDAEQKPEVAK